MITEALRGGVKFFTFPHLEATGQVVHGFTTRDGGVSSGAYAGLNTAFHVGDAAENVLANRSLACRALGINPQHLVAGRQVHGDRVEVVRHGDRGRGAMLYEDALPDTDALVTGERDVPLSSYYADCVPLFLFDPVKQVIALAHAGWKGTALKIGQQVIRVMTNTFGSDPKNCLAGVGPSIGPCCYEVDERVMGPFQRGFSFWRDVAEIVSPGKWKLNLWEANRRNLLESGIRPENVVVAGICTCCSNEVFFSYRAQGGHAGRMASLFMLK